MHLLISLVHVAPPLLRSRRDLVLENLALRQQLGVLKVKRPCPRLRAADRMLWVILHRLWPKWKEALIIVQPETVIRWHRDGFRRYWRWKPRRGRVGRLRIEAESRDLVRRLASENPTWGAPRVHEDSPPPDPTRVPGSLPSPGLVVYIIATSGARRPDVFPNRCHG